MAQPIEPERPGPIPIRGDRAEIEAAAARRTEADSDWPTEQTLELREEQLVAHKELRQTGEVHVRTEVEEVPGRLELDAIREEAEIEHEPIGRTVTERVDPWVEGDELVVPIYEEQLVVSKRLVLKEQLRIRRVQSTEHHLFEEALHRERLVIEDPAGTGLVHEQFPNASEPPTAPQPTAHEADVAAEDEVEHGGFLDRALRRVIQ